jgi:hypothetical protein
MEGIKHQQSVFQAFGGDVAANLSSSNNSTKAEIL